MAAVGRSARPGADPAGGRSLGVAMHWHGHDEDSGGGGSRMT